VSDWGKPNDWEPRVAARRTLPGGSVMRHTSGTPTILHAAADEIERLQARIDALELEVIEGADVEAMRLMYRRGYFAGHAAGKSGRDRDENPECKARGELRQRLRGAP
jgi:hypothetical protein